MGWGAPKKARHEIVPVQFVTDREMDLAVIGYNDIRAQVIDMNAVLRQKTIMIGKITIEGVIKRFLFPYIYTLPNLEYVFFCWDNPENHVKERFVYYENERYPTTEGPARPGYVICETDGREYKEDEQPLTEEEINNMTIDGTPGGSWTRAMNSKESKKRTWQLMVKVLKAEMEKRYPQIICAYGHQDGTLETIPAGIDEDMVHKYHDRWGEADQRIMHMALVLSEKYDKVLVSTNDNDMNLQVLSFYTSRILLRQIDYNVIENYEDEQYFSRTVAIKTMTDAGIDSKVLTSYQFIDCARLMQMYPTWNIRLSVQFMAFAINGVDYCSGLTDYGVPPMTCLNIIAGLRRRTVEPFVTISGTHLTRKITLHVNKLLTAIVRNGYKKASKKNKPIYDDIAAFNVKIQRIMFCVLYFSGFDSGRTPPGPVLATDNLFVTCTTTSQLYTKTYPQHDRIYTDMYPEMKVRINPTYNYPPEMAQALMHLYNEGNNNTTIPRTVSRNKKNSSTTSSLWSSSEDEQRSRSSTPTLYGESETEVEENIRIEKTVLCKETLRRHHKKHADDDEEDTVIERATTKETKTVLTKETLRLHNKRSAQNEDDGDTSISEGSCTKKLKYKEEPKPAEPRETPFIAYTSSESEDDTQSKCSDSLSHNSTCSSRSTYSSSSSHTTQ